MDKNILMSILQGIDGAMNDSLIHERAPKVCIVIAGGPSKQETPKEEMDEMPDADDELDRKLASVAKGRK